MHEELILKYVELYKERILEYEAKVSGMEDEILSKLGYNFNEEDYESGEDWGYASSQHDALKGELSLPFKIKNFAIALNRNSHFEEDKEENEKRYNQLIFTTFKYLFDHLGENKLKELIITDYISENFKGLNFGCPKVFLYIDYEVDKIIDPDQHFDENFKNSNNLISLLLDEFNPAKTFVFNIGYSTPFFGYEIKKYSGITSNEREYNLFKNAYENCEILKSNYPDNTNKFEKKLIINHKKFDLVVTYPVDLFRETKKGSDLKRYLIESLKCLNDSGNLLFIAPTNLTLNQNFKESLNKQKVYISAIFETDDTSLVEGNYEDGIPWREYIPLSIFLISKNKIDHIFSCQIQEKNVHYNKAVLKNYFSRTKGKIPSMGTFIKLNDFRGNKFNQWLCDIKKQYKNTSIKPRKLREISKEIGLVDKNKKVEENDNSLYIDPNGKGHSKTKINLELDHEKYFYIKLKDEIDSIYLSEYFNSKIGELTFLAYQFQGLSQDRMDIEILKNILLFIPDYKSQLEIIRTDNALKNQLNYSKETLKKLFSAEVHKNKKILQQVNKLNDQDIGFKNWIDSLPFPIGSILLLYYTSGNKDEKISFLLSFFEAYSEFLCVILLSCISQDPKYLLSNKHNWVTRKKWIEKSDFGGWVRLLDGLRKFISNEIKNGGKRKEKVYQILGTKDDLFINFITNGQIIDILELANQKRNDWKAHEGLHDQNDSRLNQLESLLNNFRNKVGYIFDEFKLIKPGSNIYQDGIYYFKECLNLVGGSSPFKKINLDSQIALDNNRLYFQFENNLKPIKLLPFITYDEHKGAIYFYSKITIGGDEIRYITHHYRKDKIDNKKSLTEEFKEIIENLF